MVRIIIKKHAKKFILLLVGMGVILNISGLLGWIDEEIFNESIKDINGKYIVKEDWSAIESINDPFDYAWLKSQNEKILIAHGLGESGKVEENTISAMKRSLASGMKLMEIDLWLDEDGIIRCHHGPELPLKFKSGDCTFFDALKFAEQYKIWLVLDIKNRFEDVSSIILNKIDKNVSKNIVFQLYRPEHCVMFNEWRKSKPLAGPIVTLYLSKRSVNHVLSHVDNSKFRVVTLRSNRLPSVSYKSSRLKLLTYPIYSCDDYDGAKKYNVDGYFLVNKLVSYNNVDCK